MWERQVREGCGGSSPWDGRKAGVEAAVWLPPVSTTFLSQGRKPEREKAEPLPTGALDSHRVRELWMETLTFKLVQKQSWAGL